MNLWAIIPVKPFDFGKSRLSSVLSDQERRSLNVHLFSNTFNVVQSAPAIKITLVISQDQEVLTLTEKGGGIGLVEKEMDLNGSLQNATEYALQRGAESVLIIPADLPMISKVELQQAVKARYSALPEMMIAPDRKGKGTNLLMVSPPGTIEYQFGVDSFRRHTEQARKKNITIRICSIPSFGVDLDLPEDIKYVRQSERSGVLNSFFAQNTTILSKL